jgi:hypothetical protein
VLKFVRDLNAKVAPHELVSIMRGPSRAEQTTVADLSATCRQSGFKCCKIGRQAEIRDLSAARQRRNRAMPCLPENPNERTPVLIHGQSAIPCPEFEVKEKWHMKRLLFTERMAQPKPRVVERLDGNVRAALFQIVQSRIESNWFGSAFPLQCPDGRVNAGTDENAQKVNMAAFHVVWPGDVMHQDTGHISDSQVFDLLL